MLKENVVFFLSSVFLLKFNVKKRHNSSIIKIKYLLFNEIDRMHDVYRISFNFVIGRFYPDIMR